MQWRVSKRKCGSTIWWCNRVTKNTHHVKLLMVKLMLSSASKSTTAVLSANRKLDSSTTSLSVPSAHPQLKLQSHFQLALLKSSLMVMAAVSSQCSITSSQHWLKMWKVTLLLVNYCLSLSMPIVLVKTSSTQLRNSNSYILSLLEQLIFFVYQYYIKNNRPQSLRLAPWCNTSL